MSACTKIYVLIYLSLYLVIYLLKLDCVVLCIVCVYTCTVLLPPGVNPIAVEYIILFTGPDGEPHPKVGNLKDSKNTSGEPTDRKTKN
jgi:hypothetical protein